MITGGRKPPRYKAGQRVLVPFVVVDTDFEEFVYRLDVVNEEPFDCLYDELGVVSVSEETLTDMIEFSDPDIRKQKIKDKIEKLQQEYNSI